MIHADTESATLAMSRNMKHRPEHRKQGLSGESAVSREQRQQLNAFASAATRYEQAMAQPVLQSQPVPKRHSGNHIMPRYEPPLALRLATTAPASRETLFVPKTSSELMT
jgi:hypothetical protein